MNARNIIAKTCIVCATLAVLWIAAVVVLATICAVGTWLISRGA